ncbi:response regulator transcription factor [Haploplasma modicum]|uniref:response regulator transcription factor n=1 Tax=Haploplasma modicum TaxID=2150 RepID=UPI00214C7648|nr:response regulator transcription factor [Haploplasma modicum]MCR1809411.1 response regulator transcription factor [Haploplasma modicum]
MLIYFLEDDEQIAYIIEKTITHAGYLQKGFDLAKDFLKALEKQTPDLVILDIMLPDMSGFEVIKKIREFYKDLPIIMLSALNSEMDKVKALDMGADDYITKPFGILELTSRINAKLRSVGSKEIYVKGNLELNRGIYKCYINNLEINLTTKEFEILALLLKNEGKVVTKETLFNEIWQMDNSVETRTLDVHMKSLRAKIKDADFEIETIRGVGFSL